MPTLKQKAEGAEKSHLLTSFLVIPWNVVLKFWFVKLGSCLYFQLAVSAGESFSSTQTYFMMGKLK